MFIDAEGQYNDVTNGGVWECAVTICDPMTGSTEAVLFDETSVRNMSKFHGVSSADNLNLHSPKQH